MLFRGLVVIALGSSLYSDEFSMFKCDTKQPGCIQVCFNKFTPMNPIRFWTFQMVFLFIPTIFFYAYANNFNNRVEKVEQLRKDIEQLITPENSIKEYNFSEAKELRKREAEIFLKQKRLDKSVRELGVYKSKVKIDVLEGPPDTSKKENSQILVSSKLKIMYILHCLVKILIELIFLYLNYLLQAQQSQTYDFGFFIFGQTWTVPERYLCSTEKSIACNQQMQAVSCWISRPFEKTMFLKYMVGLTYISIVVSSFEILEMLLKSNKSRLSKRKTLRALRKFESNHNGHARNGKEEHHGFLNKFYRPVSLSKQDKTKFSEEVQYDVVTGH